MDSYDHIIDRITNARRFGSRPGAEVTAQALSVLGHPEYGMPYLHVAGTNGKGSVCAFLGCIFKKAGMRVGVFTSPHLLHFEERITVNGQKISREDVTRLGSILLHTDFGEELTMFDYCLLMAVLYFREQDCDLAVMETGLGGRLDSTNALGNPLLCIITKIGMDHTEFLGDRMEQIAAEKAGILREGVPAVFAPQEGAAEKVLSLSAEKLSLRRCGEEAFIRSSLPNGDGAESGTVQLAFSNEAHGTAGGRYCFLSPAFVQSMKSCPIGPTGEFQYENAAAAALSAAYVLTRTGRWRLSSTDQTKEACGGMYKGEKDLSAVIDSGLIETVWPGRMMLLSQEPYLLADGAHNPCGAAALLSSLRLAFPGEKFHFFMGSLSDKQTGEMIDVMAPAALDFVTFTPRSNRALSAEELAEQIRKRGLCARAAQSVQDLPDLLTDGKNIAFGSLYFIGEICGLYGREP